MSTCIYTLIQDLDRKWDEVSVLLKKAEELDDSNPLIIPLCKALTVLIVANLEGHLQNVLKALVTDVNDNNFFAGTHYNMKRTQCLQYFPDSSNSESSIRKLISKFEETSVKYDADAFLFERGKNPKMTVMERIYESVGGKSFWGYISDCEVERVFENDRTYISNLASGLREELLNKTESFPYTLDICSMGVNQVPKRSNKECLWGAFIDHILTYRNYAAHGDDVAPLSVEEIKTAFEKIKVLELLSTALIAHAAISSTQNA